jgi:hypothetical protein
MFRPLLSAINQAGGGVAFEKGGITRYQTGSIAGTQTRQAFQAAESQASVRSIVEGVMQNMPPILAFIEDIREREAEYDNGVNRATIA